MGRPDEELLLELLNTTPLVGDREVDELAVDEDAARWLRAHGADPETDAALTREVRTSIQRVVRGEAPASSLSGYVAAARSVPVIDQTGVDWRLELPGSGAFAARMVLTWGTLTREHPGRLRPCANDECQRFLIDRSKANSAQWCSMALCGNRMKARRHYQRTRVGAG